MNKINKKAVLTANTADICQHVVLRWRKTLVFGITWKMLIISMIDCFDVYENVNRFQEPMFLEPKTAVSCRWNCPFLHQEASFFERKSMELDSFYLLPVLEDVVLCHTYLANHRFWFSRLLKTAMMIFLYDIFVSGKQIIAKNWLGWKREEDDLSHYASPGKTNASAVGAWFITFRFSLRPVHWHGMHVILTLIGQGL